MLSVRIFTNVAWSRLSPVILNKFSYHLICRFGMIMSLTQNLLNIRKTRTGCVNQLIILFSLEVELSLKRESRAILSSLSRYTSIFSLLEILFFIPIGKNVSTLCVLLKYIKCLIP